MYNSGKYLCLETVDGRNDIWLQDIPASGGRATWRETLLSRRGWAMGRMIKVGSEVS